MAAPDHELARLGALALLGERDDEASPVGQAVAFLRRVEALQSGGMPERVAAAICGRLADTPATSHAARIAEAGAVGTWILAGPSGTGKSVAAAKALASCGGGLWREAAVASESWADWAATERALLAASRIVIDDAGAPGTTSDKAAERIAALVARRHNAGRWTAITSNHDRAAFFALYDGDPAGGRIADRMAEAGGWLVCDGPSLRGRAPSGGDYRQRAGAIVGAYEALRSSREDLAAESLRRALDLLGASEAEAIAAHRAEAEIRAHRAGLLADFAARLAVAKTIQGAS